MHKTKILLSEHFCKQDKKESKFVEYASL